jgi:hypothetical protein
MLTATSESVTVAAANICQSDLAIECRPSSGSPYVSVRGISRQNPDIFQIRTLDDRIPRGLIVID